MSNTMVRETWTTVAVPILEELLTGELTDARAASAMVVARSSSDKQVHATLSALIEDGYIGGASVHWGMGRGEAIIVADVLRLTPNGRRAAGDWPSGQPGDVLIRALEAAIIQLPEGETRTRLSGLLDAARQVGIEVLSSVVTNVLKSTTGLP